MFEELAGVIEGLDVPSSGDAIAAARRLLDRLEATIAEAEAEYVKAGMFEVEGFADMAAFERHVCRMTLPESRRVARRAARVAAWPEVGEAWRAGRLTGAQVELAAAIVPRRHVERFAENAVETIEIIAPLTAHHTGIVLRNAMKTAEAFAEREAAEAGIEPAEVVPERELSAHRTLDDDLFVRGNFDADSGAYIDKALTAATRPDLDGEQRTPMQRRADALVEICQSYLEGLKNPDGNRRTERLTLTADVVALYRSWLRAVGVRTGDDLEDFFDGRPNLGEVDRGLFLDAFDGSGGVAHTLHGRPVTDALLSAVAAGGVMELLLTSGDRILNHGRSVRNFTAAQRRAILTRDGGCRTCGARPEKCDIHHVVPWDEGGTTDLANGLAKCRRCHLLHHRKKWRDRLDPDGTYVVTTDRGDELVFRPEGLSGNTPVLPMPTASSPAKDLGPTRRHCQCACLEHPTREEQAVHDHCRAMVLERLKRDKLGLGA